jgi:2,4-dienoyl-CoA reductase-like NADH-dependent reductase (Old Yellow Enzyme family)
LIIVEATAVSPEGRISPFCNGLWKDEHMEMQRRVVNFVHENQGHIGIQIGHAGRKGSTKPPFYDYGRKGEAVSVAEGGFPVVAPSAIKFADDYPQPEALTVQEIKRIMQDFKSATRRAREVGYDVIEIHGAHGYLITEFCSPLTNTRTDEYASNSPSYYERFHMLTLLHGRYGGSFENRIRFLLETVDAVRSEWPLDKPLFVRLSCTDWHEHGWKSEDTVKLVGILKSKNVDVIDCSTGGTVAGVRIPVKPGYQVPYSSDVKKAHSDQVTGTVGVITDPHQAEQILQNGDADFVLMAREFLRDPHWPLRAAHSLKVNVHYPPQYERSRQAFSN